TPRRNSNRPRPARTAATTRHRPPAPEHAASIKRHTNKESAMPHVTQPTVVQAAGNMPKSIEEFIGRVNSGTSEASVARMVSPAGWEEPGQTPEFNEYTVVLRGALHIETRSETFEV